MAEAFIVAAARTAGGRRNGRLAHWHPVDLAAQVLNGLLDRSGIDPALVDDVIMGCCGQAGEQSTNVARNAVLASRLPESVPGTSLDRQCGSSQQALHFAAQAVMSGTMDVVIASGVESMTRVPMSLPSEMARKAGLGFFMSPEIRRRYPGPDFSQFLGAEMIATKYGLARADLDRFANDSHLRAIAATQAGKFKEEIVVLDVLDPDGQPTGQKHDTDEGIRFNTSLESIASVRLIQEGGSVTAASASQICDGASGVMVVNERGLRQLGIAPLARIHHISVMGHDQ
jgi:acetyl-CoA C-acetyltransferase